MRLMEPFDLQVFDNPEFGQVRTITEDGRTLFCGNDVAKSLGYSNPRDALERHCRGVVKRDTPTASGMQTMSFIPEGDIYRLIIRSKLPGAERFESWIFDEVLPSIRRTGGYQLPQDYPSALRALADAVEKTARLEADNQAMRPKADYFDALVDRNLLTGFRETAKEFGIGQKTLIRFLLDSRYLYRDQKNRLMPYAPYVDSGLFAIKEYVNDWNQWSGTQTLITPKGRETFRLLLTGIAERSEVMS